MSEELTEERWRRLESLFHAARDLGPEARRGLLECETAGDPELRRQLEEMLAHAGGAAGRLERTVWEVARRIQGGWPG